MYPFIQNIVVQLFWFRFPSENKGTHPFLFLNSYNMQDTVQNSGEKRCNSVFGFKETSLVERKTGKQLYSGPNVGRTYWKVDKLEAERQNGYLCHY